MAQCQLEEVFNMKKYTTRLIELRKEHNFTQKYVADYLKIDRSNYSKYELGKLEPNIDMLILLSELYGVSVDYIVGTKDY